MEILRVPPYPIVTSWDVPEANTDYVIYIEDLVDHSYENIDVSSDSDSKITYQLSRANLQFDREFLFRVYDLLGEIVVDENLTVYRPYVNPGLLGTTASEIAEYKELEIISRSIIDSYLSTSGGFYNHKLVIQQVGQGTDYFPIWHYSNRILKAYENNVLVFNGEDRALIISDISTIGNRSTITTAVAQDYAVGESVTFSNFADVSYNRSYLITDVVSPTEFKVKAMAEPVLSGTEASKRTWEFEYKVLTDNSAIIRNVAGVYNRFEKKPLSSGRANGDLGFYYGGGLAFPNGYDYTFVMDVGFKAIPPEIELAAKYLIDDLKCGTNDYYKRFVTQYSTDQFDIKFAPQFLEGTGNIIVDKILSNYKGNNLKPGIL